MALPDDSIANHAVHRDEQISASAQSFARNAAAFACDAQHAIAQVMVCHWFEACANDAVRSGHACAL
ncbi:hypothetical protein XcvCFBP7112P_00160 [Xanthomonas citri pv. vignicola]|nr:hypothetical protein XcvCFBP7112P_00160 [Xanthomonas citri pv. vignicola]MBZ3933803.1 hypothetical protein [Xanthomonas campestris pv. merremiae]